MKRLVLLSCLFLIACGKSGDVNSGFVGGDNPANAPVAHYEGTCFYQGCNQFLHLEVRRVNGGDYIYHDGIVIPVQVRDVISLDKNGLTCNYLVRTR